MQLTYYLITHAMLPPSDKPLPSRPTDAPHQSTSTVTPSRTSPRGRAPVTSLPQLFERLTLDNAQKQKEVTYLQDKVGACMTFLQEVRVLAEQLQEAVNYFEDVLSVLAPEDAAYDETS